MGTQLFDIDINAKLPIIRAESVQDALLNGIVESNKNHSQQNGVKNNHNHNHIRHDGDSYNHHQQNLSNHSKNITNNNNKNNNNNHQLDLPKPTFRPASNCAYKKRNYTYASNRREKDKQYLSANPLSTTNYYHYQEPTAAELYERVEYDMDEEDTAWLKLYNDNHGKPRFNHVISENDFERIMDRLEKESYFESKIAGKKVVPEVDEDAVCAICNDGDCHNANVILFCDMCDLAVHQECYGVPYIPEGQWHCRRCLQSPSRNVDCVLCPNKGGAFKQTDDNQWAHVICALWIPEVCFANTVFLEPIESINQIPPARWKLQCYICKQKNSGACIQCHKPNCYVPFHVTCAQQANLHMKISNCKYDTPEGPMNDVKKEAFCDQHRPKDGKNKGGMYSCDDTDEEEVSTKAYKKWKQSNKEQLKKTRKILAEKRVRASNPIAEPTIPVEKLNEIAKLLTMPKCRKRKPSQQFEELRKDFICHFQGYWTLKRNSRSGVPLLRRLQVSYNNSANKASSIKLENQPDQDRYTRMRYDLEKARLLVGEVKKREILKMKLFKFSKDIVEKKFQVIDKEHPPNDE